MTHAPKGVCYARAEFRRYSVIEQFSSTRKVGRWISHRGSEFWYHTVVLIGEPWSQPSKELSARLAKHHSGWEAFVVDENTYSNYYWRNDKVRLRLWLPKDAEYNYLVDLDSEGMSLVHEEITLPPEKQVVDEHGGSAKQNPAAPAFSIETLDGEYVGHIHFNYIS